MVETGIQGAAAFRVGVLRVEFEQDDRSWGEGSGEGVVFEGDVREGFGFDLFGGGKGVVGGDCGCGEDGAAAVGRGEVYQRGSEGFGFVGVCIDERKVDGAVFGAGG